MVDNVQITAGTGTTVAADDIAGVLHQRVKVSIGADGSATDALGGAGAVAAGVLRVTLASDDPAVANTSRLTSSAGPTAPGAALSTTSLMVGARYNATPPTFTDGQEGGLQVDANGRLLATLQSVGPVAAGTAAAKSNLSAGVYNSSPITLTNGQQAATQFDSAGRTLVKVDAALPTGTNSIGAVTNTYLTNALIGEYETVAASQTAQVLGATGAAGDYLAGVLIVPATTSPGNVIILDNATSITIFTGGASSVSNLVPFMVPLGMTSVSGAWKITTGANVSCIGVGNFT